MTSITRLAWASALAGVCLGAPNAAFGQKRAVALEDYFRVETATASSLSPDGRAVAYVRTRVDRDGDRRVGELWLADVDGSTAPRRLSPPDVSAGSPRWSPDGRLIVYSARPLDASRATTAAPTSPIWFLRVDTPDARPYQIAGVDTLPTFSPDSAWIAFAKKTVPPPPATAAPESPFDVQLREHFKGRVIDWLEYRFDQRGYLANPRDPAASPAAELHVMPVAGGEARQLTTLGVDVTQIAWRPDGQALAVVADAYARDEYTYERADVWVVDLAGGTRRLTDDGYNHGDVVWSPDGRSLAMRRGKGLSLVIKERAKAGAPIDLVRIPAAGGPLVNLTEAWDLIPDDPVWSKDGSAIYVDAEISGNVHLFRVPASGGDVRQMTTGDRQLGSITFDASTSRIAYTETTNAQPADVFTSRVDGTDVRRLSTLNASWIDGVALGPVERLRFSSKDGTPVEGWVVLPPGYDRTRRYPMVLDIHGGPHGAFGNAFAFEHQYLAANGYVVLYTNPRGSTGYGEAFLWGTWGGWGVRDYEDVMAGVDAAVKTYAIDPGRLGVKGYSYGGFLTNWIVTQTTRFKAAAVGAGISNWISDYGTADIPRTKESEFFGTPWDAGSSELMWELSPIKHAAHVVTPTIFLHGEADMRVPIEQGEQMYTALQKRNVASRFVRYPGMYHGGWSPWNTVHRYRQELDWWGRYLGGASADRPTAPAPRR
ncbi:MAG: S9 family peptidase [Vicinamibacterales bacterium]